MAVLASETVDGSIWAEAVKWLLLFGPRELREMMVAASSASFFQCFPGVRAKGHSDSGQPYYALEDLAEALGVPVEETAKRLLQLQSTLGVEFLVEDGRVYKVN